MRFWLCIELALMMLLLVLVQEDIAPPILLLVGWSFAVWRAERWRSRYVATQIRYSIDGVIKRDVQ